MLSRAIGAFIVSTAALCAQDGNALFRDTIQPVLAKSCLPCHNQKLKQAGLDLSSREAALKGSETGPVIVSGKPEDSRLYKLVAHISQPGMPFQSPKLPDDTIAKIAEWIKAGAPYGTEAASPDGVDLAEVRKHWAFRKPAKPSPPAVRNQSWVRNPIDAFVAAGQEKRGLAPLPEADKRTLLRRVYIDLTGLPPDSAEVAAFLADSSPKAYEKVVDKLLASPRYGERWGRHWLDIWRYSDWYGYRKTGQVRYSQKHIWRWRDWTIEALNQNKPYSRMIEEMLAGDELAPGDPNVARATGYLARNYYMFNRNVWLQDTVEFTSAAFLGLTLKCARCHSHKYDPIPHADYYRFRAFFEPHEVRIDRVAGQADRDKDGLPRVYDADASKPTYRFVRGNENNPDLSTPLEPAVPQLFGKVDLKIQPVTLPADAYFPDGRPFIPDDLRAQAKAAVEKAEADLNKAREKKSAEPLITAASKRVDAAKAAIPALEARIKADQSAMATPVPDNIEQLAEEARKLEHGANVVAAEADLIQAHYEFDQARANPEKTDEKKLSAATNKLEAALKSLKEPAEGYTPMGPKYPATSSGRRLALANWIASKDNPLTARVAINHMWLRHFGKPLVPTTFNFGRNAKPPTHPELLDWLAVEFMDRGWDMKAIHRLMVTSSAYRMQSSGYTANSPQMKIDADNTWLWHMNSRRLEAEAVRDSILALAGKLDTTMYGADVDPDKSEDVYRRSIYFRQTPDMQVEMLKVFDVASPNECFQRSESVVPQQALALSNSSLSFDMARVLAGELNSPASAWAGEPPPARDFVRLAFERILGRQPSRDEATASLEYLESQAALYKNSAGLDRFASGGHAHVQPAADPAQHARESLVHVLFNHNDFVTVR
jgi:cytochrome c553